MFIKTNCSKARKRLLSFGAKEIKQNNDNFYIFIYDKDVLARYNEKFNQRDIFFTDRMYFV